MPTPAKDLDDSAVIDTSPMARLMLFGRMRAVDSSGRSILPRGRKTRALLAILALSPNRVIQRSRAAALLWSLRGQEQARASLRQSVHELQHVFREVGTGLLRTDRHQIALSTTRVWTDIAAFSCATASHPELLALFCRPLVEDLHGVDPGFDRWLAERNNELTQIGRNLGEMILAAQTGVAAILAAAEQLLRFDATHQVAWRAVIGAHLAQDDPAAAQAAYERCRSALAQRGASAPSAELERLAAAIPPRPQALAARRQPPAAKTRPGTQGAIRLGVFPLRRVDRNGDEALVLALAEEITTALAQFRWMTCRTYLFPAEQEFDPARHHADLDFVLDGTIQRSGGRVRIIVQLSDLRAGGTVVWARRFDRDLSDIFALQDEIASETASQIDTTLLLWEGRRVGIRRLADPDAAELMLGAIPSIYRLERQRFRKAGSQLETSLSLDPGNASAHAWLAYWHLFLVGQGWADDPAAATMRAAELAERAVGLDVSDARAVTLAGHVRGFLNKRPDEGRALHDRAIALNPNLALAWCFSGLAHSYLGDHAEAMRRVDHARRLAPHDPHGFFFDTAQIMPRLLSRQFEAAASIGRRAIALNPGFSSAYKGVLAALGHLRRDREAAELCRRLLDLEPGFSVRDAITRSPMVREEDMSLYADGLRLAGLPDG